MKYNITIGGSLIPVLLRGITELLEQNFNPTSCEYTFNSADEELIITDPLKDTQVPLRVGY